MNKSITFGELESALKEFGYEPRHESRLIVFEHSQGNLMIILPKMSAGTKVTLLHLKVVEQTIRGDGVVHWDDFQFFLEHGKRTGDFVRKGDRLIWTVPGTGREINVAAAADEQDGLVIIKQKGTFSPCPVDQLRKQAKIPSS